MTIAIALYLLAGLAFTVWIGLTAFEHGTVEDWINPDYLKPVPLALTGLLLWLFWGPLVLGVGILTIWRTFAVTERDWLARLYEEELEASLPEYENRPVPQALLERVRAERAKEMVN